MRPCVNLDHGKAVSSLTATFEDKLLVPAPYPPKCNGPEQTGMRTSRLIGAQGRLLMKQSFKAFSIDVKGLAVGMCWVNDRAYF